jgi:hypothetical protein
MPRVATGTGSRSGKRSEVIDATTVRPQRVQAHYGMSVSGRIEQKFWRPTTYYEVQSVYGKIAHPKIE